MSRHLKLLTLAHFGAAPISFYLSYKFAQIATRNMKSGAKSTDRKVDAVFSEESTKNLIQMLVDA